MGKPSRTLKQEVSELSAAIAMKSDRELWTMMFCASLTGYASNGTWQMNGKVMDDNAILQSAANDADKGIDLLNKRYRQVKT